MRRRVIMSGPLPPAVGGMAAVLDTLANSSLPTHVQLRFFETGKTTPVGRSTLTGVFARLRLMVAWWKELGVHPRPIAHIHTCSGLTFFLDGLLLLLARARGAPTVLHVHGARFDAFLDGLGDVRLKLARWIARKADVVVVLSDDWRARLASRLPGSTLRVVSNGVTPFSMTPARTRDVAAPTFLFLGNLGRRKGVHVLLEAVARSRSKWRLLLAGGEEEAGFADWTRSEVARLGIQDRVELLGPIVGAAKQSLLARSDAFVLPSLAEGLPMALLEAMAAGLPVVVTSVGAMPEVVRNEREGLVVPPDDAAALALALDRVAASSEYRQALGHAASIACERDFGVDSMVEKLLGVYSELSHVHG